MYYQHISGEYTFSGVNLGNSGKLMEALGASINGIERFVVELKRVR
jgi:hypothetical protein